MAQTHQPFDKLFKTSFNDIGYIKELIATYFDAEITQSVLFDTIKIIANENLNAAISK